MTTTSEKQAVPFAQEAMTRPGYVVWHSSEEEGGPDVGITVGLGDGKMLWVGERSGREGDGMGLLVYGDKAIDANASLGEYDEIRDLIEQHVAPALARLAPIEGVAASIPEGMVSWIGGECAPTDWDGGNCLNKDGDLVIPLTSARWASGNIAAYTRSPAIPEGTSGEGVDVTALQERIADLESELDEALYEPWPKWAEDMKKQIRAVSGYDGYDDATDGVNLPDELSELINELTEQADKNVAEARASRKLDELESSVEHCRNGMNEWIAKAQALTPDATQTREAVLREYYEATEDLVVLDGQTNDPAGFIIDWAVDDIEDEDQEKWDRFCDARDAARAALSAGAAKGEAR